MSVLRRYFNWLQRDNPVGEVIHYPKVAQDGSTQIPGLYLAGDITGLPLLKFAAKQGHETVDLIKQWLAQSPRKEGCLDLVVVGAGAAGLAAALRAKEQGLEYIVLEASRVANTIANFPAGKLIYAEPEQVASPSSLPVRLATKEELLASWHGLLERERLNIRENSRVETLRRDKDGVFEVRVAGGETLLARAVIVAVGKSGSTRRLFVPGEELPKVTDKLYSPLDYSGQDVLVVGGGDTAVETAVALAGTGNRVTLSYRKGEFSRVRPENRRQIELCVAAGTVRLILNSRLKEIRSRSVVLEQSGQRLELTNDVVFRMTGTELPYGFLSQIGLSIEGAWTITRFLLYALSVLVFTLVYFGKHLNGTQLLQRGDAAEWIAPALIVVGMMGTVTAIYLRSRRVSGWRGLLAPLGIGLATTLIALFSLWYVSGQQVYLLLGQNPGFWYSALYTLAIIVFGVRRMLRHKTRYVTLQTTSLILFQTLLLFLLPVFLPTLAERGYVPQWLIEQAFPDGSYWRVFGFVLAYPLFIYNVLTDQPIFFWLILSLVQTFLLLPLLIYFYGKGVYCGWICSCGGLAETLGDSYRTLAPHSERAKRLENVGQVVLGTVILLTLVWMLGHWTPLGSVNVLGVNLKTIGVTMKHWYELIIDIGFAGTIGLGTYFFYSGRIWCRYGCPLAALMHVYAKFSTYRIFADKQKCISCNLCTRACHMGIDVMGYASQGRPMDDVQCVRCSACINACPMDVLSFGRTESTPLYQLSRSRRVEA